jgi:hypothetical protein
LHPVSMISKNETMAAETNILLFIFIILIFDE